MREAAWGGGLLLPLLAERLRVSGDGVAAQRAYVTAAPIKRKSALGDYPLFLGIGRLARLSREHVTQRREFVGLAKLAEAHCFLRCRPFCRPGS
jgi:hypothetical protein